MSKQQKVLSPAIQTKQLPKVLAAPAAQTGLAQDSAIRIPDVPTLEQMVQEGRASDLRIKQSTQECLEEWFRQSERLNIARRHYGLRGDRFVDFARQIGIDRSSAYELIKLHKWRSAIEKRCLDDAEAAAKRSESYHYPGWLTALSWFEGRRNNTPYHTVPDSDERPTPQFVFDWIKEQHGPFHLDVAATDQNAKCKDYFTKDQNGLLQKWHGDVWMNPPYSNCGAWAKKAWEYAQTGGGTVTALLPVWSDAGWFHEFVTHGEVTFIQRRIRFPQGIAGSAPFPNMIVKWSQKSARRGSKIIVNLDQLPTQRNPADVTSPKIHSNVGPGRIIKPSNKQKAVQESDIRYTPRSLAKQIIDYFRPTGVVLDPARGDSSFYDQLPADCQRDWCEVREVDGRESRDFLAWTAPADWIITNGPWSARAHTRFHKHCLDVAENVVLLLPGQMGISTYSRLRYAQEAGHGIKEVLILDWPEGWTQYGFVLTATHWQRGYKGPVTYTDLSTRTGRQSAT